MGTIVERRGAGGRIAYSAQISLMRDGAIAHRESKTFYIRQAAKDWMEKREEALALPGALDRAKAAQNDPTLADVIKRYNDESEKDTGKTKTQVLRSISAHEIGAKRCSEIDAAALCDFAKSLDAAPSTRGNYMSHLASVFTVARPMWKYPLDDRAMKDAQIVLKKMGIISKSNERDRRPTLDELDRLMTHFGVSAIRRPDSIPMQKVIAFAIFSTRRQEEISRIAWKDLEPGRVMVRDMKHPGEKAGNDTRCDLVPEAEAIVATMPRAGDRIFPFSSKTVGTNFTRACAVLGIDDLHFHDLRHDGISRLFEIGWTIPQAASVSGHRSWGSLKRYSHLRQTGDKYANWKWLELVKETT